MTPHLNTSPPLHPRLPERLPCSHSVVLQPAPCDNRTCSLFTSVQDSPPTPSTHMQFKNSPTRGFITIVHRHSSSTTKTNTCKRVTLRGCNLQENPIWQSSCQRGSRLGCSCGAHRVASCPSPLFYQLNTHKPPHTHTSLKWDQPPTTALINSYHLF